jgi:hypothetical protein
MLFFSSKCCLFHNATFFWFLYYSHFTYRVCQNLKVKLRCQKVKVGDCDIYVGVSKIIWTIRYMFCSWLYCWLGMTKYTWSTLLLPLWCRCDLDSPFLSCAFSINMLTTSFICAKEEQKAVIHFCGLKVYQVLKCIE